MIDFQAGKRYSFLLPADYLADCWAYGIDPEPSHCALLGDVLGVTLEGSDPAIEKIAALAL